MTYYERLFMKTQHIFLITLLSICSQQSNGCTPPPPIKSFLDIKPHLHQDDLPGCGNIFSHNNELNLNNSQDEDDFPGKPACRKRHGLMIAAQTKITDQESPRDHVNEKQ
jgi:hypothetical protein